MKTIFYGADTRGVANHGWLDSKHTFSFANYYNPERMSFGLLRVVNDDVVAPKMGFGTHPHDNMEIVSIPLFGDLAHKDSMGNVQTIKQGEIQVMSAGTGITHSEFNANADKAVEFFQIWVYPRAQSLKPKYDQKEFDFNAKRNDFTLVVSPDSEAGSLHTYQDVWFSIGKFNQGVEKPYQVRKPTNGVFAMVIEGQFEVNGKTLERRDAIGLWEVDTINIKSLTEDAQILLIDVPMDFE